MENTLSIVQPKREILSSFTLLHVVEFNTDIEESFEEKNYEL